MTFEEKTSDSTLVLYADGLFICRLFDVLSPMVMRIQVQQNKENTTQAVVSQSKKCRRNHLIPCLQQSCSSWWYLSLFKTLFTVTHHHMVYPAESEMMLILDNELLVVMTCVLYDINSNMRENNKSKCFFVYVMEWCRKCIVGCCVRSLYIVP